MPVEFITIVPLIEPLSSVMLKVALITSFWIIEVSFNVPFIIGSIESAPVATVKVEMNNIPARNAPR